MTESSLRFEPDGVCRFAGSITLETVPALWGQALKLNGGAAPLLFDLGEVTHTDSAALALLLELMAWGRRRGTEVRFRALPESLLALARLSNAEGLLVKENA